MLARKLNRIVGAASIIWICSFLCTSCREEEEALCGYGLIEAGQWCLLVTDAAGRPIEGARISLRGQPERRNELLPFDGYTGPGTLVSDSDGTVCLTLSDNVPFGASAKHPALDNVVVVEADGFRPMEFSFSELRDGKVGTPVPLPNQSTKRPSGARSSRELPMRCYRIVLQTR